MYPDRSLSLPPGSENMLLQMCCLVIHTVQSQEDQSEAVCGTHHSLLWQCVCEREGECDSRLPGLQSLGHPPASPPPTTSLQLLTPSKTILASRGEKVTNHAFIAPVSCPPTVWSSASFLVSKRQHMRRRMYLKGPIESWFQGKEQQGLERECYERMGGRLNPPLGACTSCSGQLWFFFLTVWHQKH